MPFDPLSIIGYVGTSAGLISFLATTVAKLEKLGRDFQDCRSLLEWHSTRLGTLELVLNGWKRLWCHNGVRSYSDEDYLYFWGPNGYRDMQIKIRLIHFEIDRIGKHLFSDFKPRLRPGQAISEEHWIRWTKILQDVNSNDPVSAEHWNRWTAILHDLKRSDQQFVPKVNWLRKLCSSVVGNATLEERLDRLKKKIDDLKDYSRGAYWSAQYLEADDIPVTDSEVTKLLRSRDYMKSNSVLLTQLFNTCNTQQHAWSLVLSQPDEEANLEAVEEEADILVQFDVFQRKRTNDNTLHAVGIVSLSSPQMSRMTANEILADVNTAELDERPSEWSIAVKSLLEAGEHNFESMLRRKGLDYRLTLLGAALGVVNWTLLLWDTPWILGMCSCRMRFAFLSDGRGGLPTFTAMSCNFLGDACLIADSVLKNRKALLLGVALMEFALSRSVTVTLTEMRQPLYFVDRNRVSEENLLNQVWYRSCKDYRLAVEYCLFYDKRMLAGSVSFRARDILLFKENVLDKLDKHYMQTLKEHRKRLGRQMN